MTTRLLLENVSKTDTQADDITRTVKNVPLAVAADELVAVVGPSGSGQTP